MRAWWLLRSTEVSGTFEYFKEGIGTHMRDMYFSGVIRLNFFLKDSFALLTLWPSHSLYCFKYTEARILNALIPRYESIETGMCAY